MYDKLLKPRQSFSNTPVRETTTQPTPWKNEHTRSRGINPVILNLGTRWTWVVNFTLRLLCLAKERRHPLKILIINLDSNYLRRCQNSECHLGDVKQVLYQGPKLLGENLQKFSRRGKLASGNCAPLPLLGTSGTRKGTCQKSSTYCTYLSYSHALNYSVKRESNAES